MNRNTFLDLSADDVKAIDLLRTRLTPLVYNLEQLLHTDFLRHQDAPPSWTTIHRQTAVLKSHLRSVHDFLNSTHHVSEDNTVVTFADILATLHPYPIPPFPAADPTAQGLLVTLLRKKLEPADENYLAERVRTASEFCHVSEKQTIEPSTADDAAANSDEDEAYGGVKRVNTNLNEDEISEIWSQAGQFVIPMYQLFEKVVKRTEDQDDDTENDLQRINELREEVGMKPATPESTPGSTPESQMQGIQETKPAKQAQSAKPSALPLGMLLKFTGNGGVDMPIGANT